MCYEFDRVGWRHRPAVRPGWFGAASATPHTQKQRSACKAVRQCTSVRRGVVFFKRKPGLGRLGMPHVESAVQRSSSIGVSPYMMCLDLFLQSATHSGQLDRRARRLGGNGVPLPWVRACWGKLAPASTCVRLPSLAELQLPRLRRGHSVWQGAGLFCVHNNTVLVH